MASKSMTTETACVVCFKDPMTIYSVQDCEHVICHECSTRLRVLCSNQECPICRQKDTNAVLSSRMGSYRLLLGRCLYTDDRYRLSFEDEDVRRAFQHLVANECTFCASKRTFGTFQQLRTHLENAHRLYYCDICAKHLKLFNRERQLYSKEQLECHLEKGDGDASTFRLGHPPCQFCNTRYLDRDELYRHLRREHCYCHLCEADGHEFFYCTYRELQEHFRRDHFLCEEGECYETKFIVFRTNIDLQAHRAAVHSRGPCQRRRPVLTLQFSSENSRRRLACDRPEPVPAFDRGFDIPVWVNRTSRNRHTAHAQNRQEAPIASEADFPGLGSSRAADFPNSGGMRMPMRTAVTINMGRRQTGSLHSPGSPVSPQPRIAQISSSGNITMQSPTMENPPLFVGGRVVDDLEAEYPRSTPASTPASASTWDTTKDRKPAADTRVRPERNVEMQRQSSYESEARLGSSNHPTRNATGPSNAGSVAQKRIPLSPSDSSSPSPVYDGGGDTDRDVNWNHYRSNNPARERNLTASGPGRRGAGEREEAGAGDGSRGPQVDNAHDGRYSDVIGNGWGSCDDTAGHNSGQLPASSSDQLPAGQLQLVTAQLAEIPLQEEATVIRSAKFAKPEQFDARNAKLVKLAREVLKTDAAFETFRQVSAHYRCGALSGEHYYRRCQTLLGADGFSRIFPELLVLLPDIDKQTELLSAHDAINATGIRRNKFITCSTCSQVLTFVDYAQHSGLHLQNGEMPEGY